MDERLRQEARQEGEIKGRLLELPYGRKTLKVELPSSIPVTVLSPPVSNMKPFASEGGGEGIVLRALASPMGSQALDELARRSGSALVVIPDKTRAAGVREYLPPVLRALEKGGLDDRDVILITANGAHAPMSETEIRKLVGRDVYERYRLLQHNSRDSASISHVGVTSRGTDVAVNSACLEAGLLVLTGAVSFHYFAGFGGGRKLLFPGLASYDSIVANHRLVLGPAEGLHPMCRSGNLEGNPVHEDIMEAFSMLPPPFVLTTVAAPDGAVLEVFAGLHDEVFAAACGAARRAFAVRIREKADLVIASCGGHPWDINLLQLHKSLRHAASAARDGGALVLVGEASEGLGSETLEKGLRYSSWREADRAMRGSYILNGHTAVSLLREVERVAVHMVTALGEHLGKPSWAWFYEDAQTAVDAALESLDVDHPLVYFMPLAAITTPHIGD